MATPDGKHGSAHSTWQKVFYGATRKHTFQTCYSEHFTWGESEWSILWQIVPTTIELTICKLRMKWRKSDVVLTARKFRRLTCKCSETTYQVNSLNKSIHHKLCHCIVTYNGVVFLSEHDVTSQALCLVWLFWDNKPVWYVWTWYE